MLHCQMKKLIVFPDKICGTYARLKSSQWHNQNKSNDSSFKFKQLHFSLKNSILKLSTPNTEILVFSIAARKYFC